MRESIEPVYRPQQDGVLLLFGGGLEVAHDGVKHTVTWQVELCLSPKPKLIAHFAGPSADLDRVGFTFNSADPTVAVPEGADLAPPTGSVLPEHVAGAWTDSPVRLNYVAAGDLALAEHFLFHVSGLEVLAPAVPIADGALQPQLDFSLPGWSLVLAPTRNDDAGRGFSAMVKTTPETPIDYEDLRRLRRRLFILFSFAANREAGVGPVCGCRGRGGVVWAEWGAPRLRTRAGSFRWCPPYKLDKALPVLAQGLAKLAEDPAMEKIVGRAVNHLLVACGEELIDARITVLAAGLDLLAWGQLRRSDWSMRKLKDLTAAQSTRHLLEWAGIPTAIPESFPILPAKSDVSGPTDGPWFISEVRNRLVHPPKRIDDPEWPDDAQLRAAWQLGTWYLELALLRVLGYQGEYQTRLELNRYAGHLEPVPWAANSS
jgi:hypothetical protein